VQLKQISIYLLCLLAVLMGWIYMNQIRAFLIISNHYDEEHLVQAVKTDLFSKIHVNRLVGFYQRLHRRNPSDENTKKLITALDLSIKQDPLNITNYKNRAKAYLRIDDVDGILETFSTMRQYAPRYYLGELMASSFYMGASVSAKNEKDRVYYEEKAIEHYNQATVYNPNLSRMDFQAGLVKWNYSAWRAIRRTTTKEALGRYKKLVAEGVIR